MRTRRRRRLPSLIVATAFVVAWWLLLAPPSLGGKTSYISVSGKSMEPTYVTGDLVMVREQSSYQPGDIVAFETQGGVVIHRIVEGDGASGYTLQGDNNSWRDPWKPTNGEVVGKAWFRLPGASKWLLTLTHPIVLAVVVTAVLGWAMMPSDKTAKNDKSKSPKPVSSTRRAMEFADLRRAFASVPRRTIAISVVAFGAAVLLAVPAVLAWLDDTERTSFIEHGRYREAAELAYTFHLEPTTLYPDGTIGPIDASSPTPPTVFAKPAREVAVTVDYEFTGAESEAAGSFSVDASLVGDAGWETALPLVENTPFAGSTAQAAFTVDLGGVVALAQQIDEETGTSSRSLEVRVQPRFTIATTADGSPIEETFTPPFTLAYSGSTWSVSTPLEAEEVQRLGTEVTEQVKLAGIPVEQLRWLALPAALLAAFAVGLITVAMRRTPALTVETLLRRPGISVIDLEQPPADVDLAVPLASAEGIRRVAERDGGLVLRYDDGTSVHLYARHDERVYSYTPEPAAEIVIR